MKTKILLTIVIIAALGFLPVGAEKKPVASAWAAAPVRIDGKLDEWPPESLTASSAFELHYGFKNDANFLYCAFVFDNPRYLSSIEASGLTFWIHPEKDKRTHGFRFYRKMVTADEVIAELEKGGNPPSAQRRAEIKARPNYMYFVCDILDKKGEIIPRQPGTANGTYRVARADKGVAFEYVIPLALLTDPNQTPALDPAKPFRLGFEWGGMTEEMRKQIASEIGAQNVQVDSSVPTMAVSGGVGERAEGQEGGGASVSLESGLRRGPKKYAFWIGLQLGEKK